MESDNTNKNETSEQIAPPKNPLSKVDKRVYKALMWLFIALIVLIMARIWAPDVVKAVFEIIWFILVVLTITFFALGILVILGLRKEVSKILDLMLEGSLTIIDFINLLRELYQMFITKLKEFLLTLAPVFAYLTAFIVYYTLLLFYKLVGLYYDITLLTIFLTIILVCYVAYLNRPNKKLRDLKRWRNVLLTRFSFFFSDALEIFVFVFFLTMESTNLFFVPERLNVHLHANIMNTDLMIRGVSLNQIDATSRFVVIIMLTEIVRYCLRVVALALKLRPEVGTKAAIRQSFNYSKDDIIKFITFTTVTLFVFLLFPKIKLLSLLIASMTSLLLDVLYRKRLTVTKGEDLIARILSKTFKL